jgi:hypothetical protein
VRPLNPANPAAGRIIGPHRIVLPARNPQPQAQQQAQAPQNPPRRPARKSSRPPRPREEQQLSDERVHELYLQYIEARKVRKESSAALSYDSLAKSLRESSARLRERNAGKRVDFEVAEKDGKTILRPVVKDK